MCIFSGKHTDGIVCNAAGAGSSNWGLSDGVCQAHFAHYKTQLANGINFGAARAELEDYVRILALMGDEVTFKAMLGEFSSDVNRIFDQFYSSGGWDAEAEDRLRYKSGAEGIRISRFLSYYEGYCWFPDTHSNYAGLLDSASFEWGLTMGLMPKDPGAGAAHGDFSHRLQWHVIMRVITDGFKVPIRSDWYHSPLKLFTNLGRGNALAARLWFFLFDNNTQKTNNLNEYVSMKYSNPDNVNSLVTSSRELGMLARALKSRWEKRRARQDEGRAYVDQFMHRDGNRRILEIWESANHLQKQCNGVAVTNLLYHWRKLKGRPVKDAVWRDYKTRFLALRIPMNFNFGLALVAANGKAEHPTIKPIVQFYSYLAERIAYEYWDQNIQLRPLSGIAPAMTTPSGRVAGADRSMDGILINPSVSLLNIAERIDSSSSSFDTAAFKKSNFGVTRVKADG